jgi:hypothetical protein
MSHLRLVTRVPQVAIGGGGGTLQNLIMLIQLSAELNELVATLQEKKGGTGS